MKIIVKIEKAHIHERLQVFLEIFQEYVRQRRQDFIREQYHDSLFYPNELFRFWLALHKGEKDDLPSPSYYKEFWNYKLYTLWQDIEDILRNFWDIHLDVLHLNEDFEKILQFIYKIELPFLFDGTFPDCNILYSYIILKPLGWELLDHIEIVMSTVEINKEISFYFIDDEDDIVSLKSLLKNKCQNRGFFNV